MDGRHFYVPILYRPDTNGHTQQLLIQDLVSRQSNRKTSYCYMCRLCMFSDTGFQGRTTVRASMHAMIFHHY